MSATDRERDTTTSASCIRYSRNERVARIELDRPPLNVLNIAMLGELNELLRDIAADRTVRVVRLSGSGKAFSAGVEVAEHLPDRAAEMLAVFDETIALLRRIEAPVVGVLHGSALGGGLELALCCDLVVCAEGTRLGQPEVRLGALAPVAAVLLPQICGPRVAAELLLTGAVVEAAEALRIGLVNRVVPADRLANEADAMVAAIARSSGPVLRGIKRVLRRSAACSGDLIGASRDCLEMLLDLEDAQEGMRSFLEKREPVWRDR
jgi:cyclohexa-1,5-dienecarbonyl-CoA hydratase